MATMKTGYDVHFFLQGLKELHGVRECEGRNLAIFRDPLGDAGSKRKTLVLQEKHDSPQASLAFRKSA